MEGFAFAVTDVIRTDADRYTFTLHLRDAHGESVIIRDCRVLTYHGRGGHLASPMRLVDGEFVKLVTLPRRMRKSVVEAVLAKAAEQEAER